MLKKLRALLAGPSRPRAVPPRRGAVLGVEALESRAVPTVSVGNGNLLIIQTDGNDTAYVTSYQTTNGVVYLRVVDNGQAVSVPAQNVTGKIYYYGKDGNDTFNNYTNVPLDADGGTGDDFISGGEGDDHIVGGLGNDTLYGGAGNDKIEGGEGDDVLRGGLGNDNLFGFYAGPDFATAYSDNDQLYGDDGDDNLYGGRGDDYLDGGIGNDLLVGDNPSGVGAFGNDTLHGGAGNDRLFGGAGNDKLYGEAGYDELHGDDLYGPAGNDYLNGGADGAADYLEGGGGADVFQAEWVLVSTGTYLRYKNLDQPVDFNAAQGDTVAGGPIYQAAL